MFFFNIRKNNKFFWSFIIFSVLFDKIVNLPFAKKKNIMAPETIPIVEEFYSLQGEGFHTGKPAYFIRVGGCEAGCSFCDEKRSWDATRYPRIAVDDIVQRAARNLAKTVVVTGGEPLLYDMTYLCSRLHAAGVKLFLETSGSKPLTGVWNWICLSPKYGAAPLPDLLLQANELKVIVGAEEDFAWAETNAAKVNAQCILYLQPDWNRYNQIINKIVKYTLRHPQWRVSLQTHKYMNIQ